mmetsp:Transcript_18033/g.31384  ORF Transcript_18033/g.31384 Transcript_18033/m.31384 type:complete len:247 (-) Transcript_18033:218-958(-)
MQKCASCWRVYRRPMLPHRERLKTCRSSLQPRNGRTHVPLRRRRRRIPRRRLRCRRAGNSCWWSSGPQKRYGSCWRVYRKPMPPCDKRSQRCRTSWPRSRQRIPVPLRGRWRRTLRPRWHCRRARNSCWWSSNVRQKYGSCWRWNMRPMVPHRGRSQKCKSRLQLGTRHMRLPSRRRGKRTVRRHRRCRRVRNSFRRNSRSGQTHVSSWRPSRQPTQQHRKSLQSYRHSLQRNRRHTRIQLPHCKR